MPLLAYLILLTYLGITTVACTTDIITNGTQHITYRIVFRNDCKPDKGQTYLHFLAGAGKVLPAQQENSPLEYSADGEFQKLTFPMVTSQTSEFNFMFENAANSSWTLWWDSVEDNSGPKNQTLLEGTCELELTDRTGKTLKCWINVSNVDGLTSGLRVDFSGDAFPPITVQPPRDWQCPERNKPSEEFENDKSFLPQGQACVSNCSLLDTDETCCRNASSTRETCSDSSPAIKYAAQEAYSFAYDDMTPFFNGKSMVMPLRAHNFASGTTICQVTLCR